MEFASSKRFKLNKSSDKAKLAAECRYFGNATHDGVINHLHEVKFTHKQVKLRRMMLTLLNSESFRVQIKVISFIESCI